MDLEKDRKKMREIRHGYINRGFVVFDNDESIVMKNRKIALRILVSFIDVVLQNGREIKNIDAFSSVWEDLQTLSIVQTDVFVVSLRGVTYEIEWYPWIPITQVELKIECGDCNTRINGKTSEPLIEMCYHLDHKVKRRELEMKQTKYPFAETTRKVFTGLVFILLGVCIQFVYGLRHVNGILMIGLFAGMSVGALAGTYLFDQDTKGDK